MFEKTQAIVIHCQKHSDKAVILHTYTELNGRMNFIVYGGNKKGVMRGIIQAPLAIVELEYDNKPGQEMHVLHSLSPVYIPEPDNEQAFVRMFISEAIYKTLRQPMADEKVYAFLTKYIRLIGREAERQKGREVEGLQEFMRQFSVLLGYGGVWLDEWKELKSLKMIDEMMNW